MNINFKKTFFKENKKVTLMLLQWLLFIIICFLVIYSLKEQNIVNFEILVRVIVLFAMFNIILCFLPLDYFEKKKFNYFLFISNIVVISLIIYFSRGFDSDLYLVYFLVILIAGITQTEGGTFALAFLSTAIYLVFLYKSSHSINFLETGVLMRFPFLFIISLISTFYAENTRKLQIKKQEIEEYNKLLQKKIDNALTEISKFHDKIIEFERISFIKIFSLEIAHELSSPLTCVKGYLELLQKQETDKINKEYLNIIFNEVMRCEKLVKQLRDYCKPQKVGKSKICILEVIDSVLKIQEFKFRKNSIAVKKEINTNLTKFIGEFDKMQQVFVNLINNSISALEGCTGEKTILIKIKDENDLLNVVLEDNGCGMEEVVLKNIFKPFFTTKSYENGTGLGLYICKEIIEQHRGKISILSQKGKGTRVEINLPLAKD
jgi:signal transduction histidine kinase